MHFQYQSREGDGFISKYDCTFDRKEIWLHIWNQMCPKYNVKHYLDDEGVVQLRLDMESSVHKNNRKIKSSDMVGCSREWCMYVLFFLVPLLAQWKYTGLENLTESAMQMVHYW